MMVQSTCKFAKNISSPVISKVFSNAEGDILTIQISGNFSSGIIYIEGRNDPSGDWVSLAGISLKDFSLWTDGFEETGLYEIDIIGVRELRANIKQIINGNISIYGQIISSQEV